VTADPQLPVFAPVTHQPLLEKLLFAPKSPNTTGAALAPAPASLTVKGRPPIDIVALKVALEALGAMASVSVPGPLPDVKPAVIQLGNPETVHEQAVWI
jgi:hypothetical protein